MTKRKGPPDLTPEQRLMGRLHLIDALASIVNRLIPWAALVFIAHWIYLAILALAGQKTIADIGISFLGSVTVSEALAVVLGGGGIAYGLKQRKLRRDTIERLQARIQDLERRLDPNRTSSSLTRRGTTNPEDIA
ncbi:MAG: hypothetical protein AB1646_19490 [Thermodesulfobacteriota bacterium]